MENKKHSLFSVESKPAFQQNNVNSKNLEHIFEPRIVTKDMLIFDFENEQIKQHEEPGYLLSDNQYYFYLNDQQLNIQIPNDSITYNVFLAIYKMHKEKPVVEYLFIEKNGIYDFPSFSYLANEQNSLQNMAYSHAMEITNAYHIDSFTPHYKGFIQLNDENLMVLYDFTHFHESVSNATSVHVAEPALATAPAVHPSPASAPAPTPVTASEPAPVAASEPAPTPVTASAPAPVAASEPAPVAPPKKYTWITLFEIIYKQSFNQLPISKIICSQFNKDKRLTNIENTYGIHIETPYTLYLCESMEKNTKSNSSFYVEPRINHPILGNYFMFSCDPLDINDNNESLCRYSVFIRRDNSQYLIDKDLDGQQIDLYGNENQIYDCIYFQQKTVPYWSIKDKQLITRI